MDDFTGPAAPEAYRHVVALAVELLDHLAVVEPDPEVMARCASSLEEVVSSVRTLPIIPEDETIATTHSNNQRFQPSERGLVPTFWVDAQDETQEVGRVCFSTRFGGTAAVHGGAISLFFDDAVGNLANREAHGALARTAYLKVDYRSLAPLETEMSCRVWLESIEGRKRLVRGEIRNGSTLIAEAVGLWVVPRSASA